MLGSVSKKWFVGGGFRQPYGIHRSPGSLARTSVPVGTDDFDTMPRSLERPPKFEYFGGEI